MFIKVTKWPAEMPAFLFLQKYKIGSNTQNPKINIETFKKSLMQKSGEIISELLDNNLQTNESKTTIEINFAVFIPN